MKKRIVSVFLVAILVLSLGSIAYAYTPVSKGDSGDAVVEIQQMLKDYGYLAGAVDGAFGNGTFEAVSAFQRDNGLEVTGAVGETTYNALLAYTGKDGKKADNDGVSPAVDATTNLTENAEDEATEAPATEAVSHPDAVIFESDCDLEITKAGFSSSDGYMYYAIYLHNNSKDKAIQYPSYRFTARDANGGILGTGEQVLNIIYPGQDCVWGGFGCDVSEAPASVEFEVIDPEDYNVISVSQLPNPEYVPLTIENSNCKEEPYMGYTFVGEVKNPNDYDFSMVGVFAVLKDASGTIVGGEMTFVDNVKAGRSVPFEINSIGNIQFASYELYAESWV